MSPSSAEAQTPGCVLNLNVWDLTKPSTSSPTLPRTAMTKHLTVASVQLPDDINDTPPKSPEEDEAKDPKDDEAEETKRKKALKQQKTAAKKQHRAAMKAEAKAANPFFFQRMVRDMTNGPTPTKPVLHNAPQPAPDLMLPKAHRPPRMARMLGSVGLGRLNHPTGIFTLEDQSAAAALAVLAHRYGRVSHMGVLDKSYSFYLSISQDAALSFKVKNGIAVVFGDPLCEPEKYSAVLAEFGDYRKQLGWGIAILAASETFAKYAQQKKWATIQFGVEQVLNPSTNPVLLEKRGKRITAQNRQLLNPEKGGVTVGVYDPNADDSFQLQEELKEVYDAWRDERNHNGALQAYLTVYDPFALPSLMTYLYTKGRDGKPNGFAALRRLGASDGYLLDPCVAAPGAPKGITDLLMIAAMGIMNTEGSNYLSLGIEPLSEIGNVTGMPRSIAHLTRAAHHRMHDALDLGGKKEYHDKFWPDEALESGLHLVFPSGMPGPHHLSAILHTSNISLRQVASSKLEHKREAKKSSSEAVPGHEPESQTKDDSKPSFYSHVPRSVASLRRVGRSKHGNKRDAFSSSPPGRSSEESGLQVQGHPKGSFYSQISRSMVSLRHSVSSRSGSKRDTESSSSEWRSSEEFPASLLARRDEASSGSFTRPVTCSQSA